MSFLLHVTNLPIANPWLPVWQTLAGAAIPALVAVVVAVRQGRLTRELTVAERRNRAVLQTYDRLQAMLSIAGSGASRLKAEVAAQGFLIAILGLRLELSRSERQHVAEWADRVCADYLDATFRARNRPRSKDARLLIGKQIGLAAVRIESWVTNPETDPADFDLTNQEWTAKHQMTVSRPNAQKSR